MLTDLRLAVLSLRRHPVFSVCCVGLLAFSLAGAVALFAVLDATLLRPLPLDREGRVWTLAAAREDGTFRVGLVSGADLVQINGDADTVRTAAGASTDDDVLLRPGAESVAVRTAAVTAGYFTLFDTSFHLGRPFLPDEHTRGSSPSLAVLSYGLWRTSFEADPAVVGTTVQLGDRRSARVTGVAGPGFDLPRGVDLWLNARSMRGRPDTSASFEGLIRIQPGSAQEIVRQQVNAALVVAPTPYNPVRPAGMAARRIAILEPLRDALLGESRSILILAWSAAVLLLVLGAVNVAGLLLIRGVLTQHDLATHLFLGADSGRILRQSVCQTGVLGVAGVTGGIVVAIPAAKGLMVFMASFVSGLAPAAPSGHVLLTALGLSLLTLLMVIVPPSCRALADALQWRSERSPLRAMPAPGSRLMAAFIGTAVGLTVLGAVGASWLVSSYRSLAGRDHGFRVAETLVVDIGVPGMAYSTAAAAEWFAEALDSVAALPGVRRAGLAVTAPLGVEREFTRSVEIVTALERPAASARFRYVSPGFFDAAGMRLLAGRGLAVTGPPSGLVVNRLFADRYLEGLDPLRARLSYLGLNRSDHPNGLPVLGIVEAARYESPDIEPEPVVYVSAFPSRGPRYRQSLVVSADPSRLEGLSSAIRARLHESAPLVSVSVELMSDRVARHLARRRAGMNAMLGFGAAAILVGTTGAYALAALGAVRRRREVAVRSALGSPRARLVFLLVRRVGTPAVWGIAGGLVASVLGGHALRSRVELLAEADPILAFAAIAGVTVAVLAAVLLPALRVAAADVPGLLRE